MSEKQALLPLPSPWDASESRVLVALRDELGCAGYELEVAPGGQEERQKDVWRSGAGLIRSDRGGGACHQTHRDRLGVWGMTAEPADAGFSGAQRERLGLVLLRWHNAFMAGPGAGGGHVLLDPGWGVVVADLQTQVELVDRPRGLQELVDEVAAVAQERFEVARPDQPVEAVVVHRDRVVWVKLTASCSAGGAPGGYHASFHPLAPDAGVPTFGRIQDARVARALGFLDTHYDQNPNLKDLAQTVDLSIYHLHRLFNEHLDMSPKQYLLCRQLQVAKHLLRTTGLPVGEIAERAGFSSSGHFSTTFNRVTGQKPMQYRDRLS